MTPLLLLAALGCTDSPTGSTGPQDTGDPQVLNSDSGSEGTTEDSASVTDTADPTDTAPPPEPDPGVLSVSPRELVVDPGATWTVRAVHTLEGVTADVAPTWESSDESVVTVSAEGVATAVGPGEATLRAVHASLESLASITVQSEPVVRVQLVAAETGLPLSDASVHCAGVSAPVDPHTGVSELTVPAAEPLWCTAWTDDDARIPATLIDLVGRRAVLPMRLRGQLEPDSEIEGTFDFSNLPPLSDDEKAAGWVILGIAGGSLRLGPLFWRADEVLSPNRDVELYGLEVSVPGNLAIHEYFEDWLAPAWSGNAGVWSMAGPVPLADAIVGLSSLDDALDFLLNNMDGFVYTYDEALTVPSDGPLALEVAPTTSLSESLQVTLPDWPEGFALDNPATLIALDGSGPEGPAVVGFGRGFAGEHHVARVPGSFFGWEGGESQVLAYLEAGGLGTLGAKSLRVADVVDGVATVGPMQSAPVLTDWDEDQLLLDFAVDGAADLVTVYVTNKAKDERDFYLPRPEGPVLIPLRGADGPEINLGTLTFEVSAVELREGTFEGLVADGAFMREALGPMAVTTSFVSEAFKVDSTRD